MTLEVLKGGVILIAARHVSTNTLELLNLIGDILPFLRVFDVLGDTFVEISQFHLCACIPDYLDVVREVSSKIQAKESWECLRPNA